MPDEKENAPVEQSESKQTEESIEGLEEAVEEAETEIGKLTREIVALRGIVEAAHKETAELANLVHRVLDVVYVLVEDLQDVGEEPGETAEESAGKEVSEPETLVSEVEQAPRLKKTKYLSGRKR